MAKTIAATVMVALCLFVGVECIVWKSCDDSGRGKVYNVTISGCAQTPVCPLKKGTNATITVAFRMNEASKSATAVVHGVVAGIPVPFPPDNPDGCKNSGLKCPLTTATDYAYSTTIYVKSEYPSIKLVVKWELQDQNAKDIFCVNIPVAITSANKNAL